MICIKTWVNHNCVFNFCQTHRQEGKKDEKNDHRQNNKCYLNVNNVLQQLPAYFTYVIDNK